MRDLKKGKLSKWRRAAEVSDLFCSQRKSPLIRFVENLNRD
jgi:hypothetical protein